MIGAIAGDIIGSVYEYTPIKQKEFPLFNSLCSFTDDSVLTIAIAKAILDGSSYRDALIEFGTRYPNAGYGLSFRRWLLTPDPAPYYSLGNGSAMRVSAVGYAFDAIDDVLREAEKTAEVSHNLPEGIKGAQATALAILLARTGSSKDEIRNGIETRFQYDLGRSTGEIRPDYEFDVTCPGTVPEAVIAFLDSASYEDAVRNAVSLGGDSDTLACIAGGIAQAFYGGVPREVIDGVREALDSDLWAITETFCRRFGIAL